MGYIAFSFSTNPNAGNGKAITWGYKSFAPSTCLGTIIKPAAAKAVVFIKSLLELFMQIIVFFFNHFLFFTT